MSNQENTDIDSFKRGDHVWIFEGGRLPREGVISNITDIGMAWVVPAGKSLDNEDVKLYSKFSLFHRPKELSKLLNVINEQIHDLQYVAKELKQDYNQKQLKKEKNKEVK